MRTPRLPARPGAFLIPLLLAAVLVPVTATGPTPEAQAVVPSATRLKVMTFNVEYGGTVIDFGSIVAAVAAADADVVALNEVYRHGARLARETGYPYHSPRMDIISRFPILDPPGGSGRYLFVEIEPGQVVALANVHLSSAPYSPRKILDGWGRARALRAERAGRLREIRPVAKTMGALAAGGIPSFILGDFNAPSHEDWTPAMIGRRPQIRFAVRWPVSRLLAKRGFQDAYRTVHPNPVTHPGLTWPAKRPRSQTSWNPRRDAPKDRIDQIWVAGAATTTWTRIVGEPGGPGVGISVEPWGSDHRAVLATVDLTPGAPPVMVSVAPRRVTQGTDLTVTYHAPGEPDEAIVVVPSGGDPATDEVARAGTIPGSEVDGVRVFTTEGWDPGTYDAVLVDAADAVLSRMGFVVRLPGTAVLVETSSPRYEVGEPIDVGWVGAPGNRYDWIGIYRRGADPAGGAYLVYRYTGSAVAGEVIFDGTTVNRWPLPRGRYTAWLMVSDQYRSVGRVDFVVR